MGALGPATGEGAAGGVSNTWGGGVQGVHAWKPWPSVPPREPPPTRRFGDILLPNHSRCFTLWLDTTAPTPTPAVFTLSGRLGIMASRPLLRRHGFLPGQPLPPSPAVFVPCGWLGIIASLPLLSALDWYHAPPSPAADAARDVPTPRTGRRVVLHA